MGEALDAINREIELRKSSAASLIQAEIDKRTKFTPVRTFDDGGEVLQDKSGNLHYKSKSYSTSDQADVLKIIESEGDAGKVAKSRQREDIIAQKPVATRMGVALKGVPFAGEWIDEAMPDESRDAFRVATDAYETEHPVKSTLMQMGMGAAATAPFAAGLASVKMGGGLAMKLLAGATGGAVAGGVEGAVSGAGRDHEDRLRGAKYGAMIGAAAGAVFGTAIPVGKAGFRNMATFVMRTPTKKAARQLGISPEAVEGIRHAVNSDGGFDQAYARLKHEFDISDTEVIRGGIGPQGTIATAGGPSVKSLADIAATSPGPGMRTVADATKRQIGGAYKAVTDAFDLVLGKAGTAQILKRHADDAAKGKKRNALYDAAFSGDDFTVDRATPAGRKVYHQLSRIKSSRLKAAISLAEEKMTLDEIEFKPVKITKKGKIEGDVTILHLDEIKKALQSLAFDPKNYDSLTGKHSGDGVFYARAARVVRDAARDYSPKYKTALMTAANDKSAEVASDFGRDMMRAGWRREDVARRIAEMDASEVAHAKLGVRSWIDDKMSDVGIAISNATEPSDIAELNKMFREMTKPKNIEKLQMVVGADDAAVIMKSLRRAGVVANLRAQVAMGSKTASRQESKSAIDALLEPGVLGKAMEGDTGSVSRAVQIMTGRTDEFNTLRTQGFLADVAEVLVNRQGPLAEQAMRVLATADISQPVTVKNAEIIASALNGALLMGGYTGATGLAE